MVTPMLEIYDLRTEYLSEPCAVDAEHPRFSWKLSSDSQGVSQEWYRITAFSEGRSLWDSGMVKSSECRCIRYEGAALQSREKVQWQVMVCAGEEVAEAGSGFTMGLLNPEDWQAKWIEAEELVAPEARKPAVYLRRSFTVRHGLREAVFYSTAHGLYEFYFNGTAGTEDKFKPGLTSYYYRIQYHTADVTGLMNEGENVLAVVLADGWWRGVTGGSVKNNFGTKLAFRGQLELKYDDGSVDIIASDETFRWSTGGLRASDMLMGDVYDARLEPAGWKKPGFSDGKWTKVHLTSEHMDAALIPCRSVPVREKERFTPREFTDAEGNHILDFDQNMAGYVRMTLHHTKRGQSIRLVHGEALDENGVFTLKNIANTSLPVDAFQEVVYICSGEEMEQYQPDFAIFGFRYVLVEGDCDAEFEAVAVYSDTPRTGWFHCSDPLLNRLAENSLWSQKGNFMDVPVDCPTRERNAWTGDAQIYARTAADFMDVYSFYEKWLQDQTLEQYDSGKVGITFPSTSSVHDPAALEAMKADNPLYELAGPGGNGNIGEDSVGWGDAAVWIPYVMYLCYGDRQILENQYETAKRWVEYELKCAAEENPLYHYEDDDGKLIYDTRFHYGEWNEAIGMDAPKEPEPPMSHREKAERVGAFLKYMAKLGNRVVATAYLCRSCETLSYMAGELGKSEDAVHYGALTDRIKKLYAKYLIGEDGVIEPGHQAPYVRALQFGLCGGKQEEVCQQLVKEVEDNGFRLNTGFLSTPFLLPVLCEIGQTETAYRILQNREKPGWIYPVLRGMTTITESWDGVDTLKDSLNHYSYGAVSEFLFAYVGGIRPMESVPGYQEFELKPVPGGTLTEAHCRFLSPYGEICSEWKIEDDVFHYSCKVPVSAIAHLTLPGGASYTLRSGRHSFQVKMKDINIPLCSSYSDIG